MNSSQIINRIEYLRTAIAYSRYTEKHMTVGQGIMCNQEIAGWFAVLDDRLKHPEYVIPIAIEDKVELINNLVITQDWQNPSELI